MRHARWGHIQRIGDSHQIAPLLELLSQRCDLEPLCVRRWNNPCALAHRTVAAGAHITYSETCTGLLPRSRICVLILLSHGWQLYSWERPCGEGQRVSRPLRCRLRRHMRARQACCQQYTHATPRRSPTSKGRRDSPTLAGPRAEGATRDGAQGGRLGLGSPSQDASYDRAGRSSRASLQGAQGSHRDQRGGSTPHDDATVCLATRQVRMCQSNEGSSAGLCNYNTTLALRNTVPSTWLGIPAHDPNLSIFKS